MKIEILLGPSSTWERGSKLGETENGGSRDKNGSTGSGYGSRGRGSSHPKLRSTSGGDGSKDAKSSLQTLWRKQPKHLEVLTTRRGRDDDDKWRSPAMGANAMEANRDGSKGFCNSR
ncbi:uncharacterized protein HKW66_Vig0117880 [Vigna angularis]|uniref:Uncharacterized protein n=1 Tax=Phaseolus angularis TaxID=3914 RepID=A0A8T0JVR8_PHAAN|nr:uncharacterized protein HKW66_Vig0117880 [Vigna angularis]